MTKYMTYIDLFGEWKDEVEALSVAEAQRVAIDRFKTASLEDVMAVIEHVYAEDVDIYKLSNEN